MGIFKKNNLAQLVLEHKSQLLNRLTLMLKLSGAQWKMQNVSGMLQLCCAYLNALLAI
jgi:hypothetical protein